MIRKIKGLLGFCQCDKCWDRTYATINIKAINRKIDVCEDHMKAATKDVTLTGIFSIEVE